MTTWEFQGSKQFCMDGEVYGWRMHGSARSTTRREYADNLGHYVVTHAQTPVGSRPVSVADLRSDDDDHHDSFHFVRRLTRLSTKAMEAQAGRPVFPLVKPIDQGASVE